MVEYYHPDRTQNLNEAEIIAAEEEQEAIYTALAACLRQGLAPTDPSAQALAERWREHRQRYYFDCSKSLMQAFAAVYQLDPRHRPFFDAYEPGLAAYFGAVLQAFCETIQ